MSLMRALITHAALLALAAPSMAAPASAQAIAPEALAALGIKVEGQVTQAWAFKDDAGEHLVVASHMASPDRQLGIQLSLVKLTKGGSRWKQDWQARDFHLDPKHTASSSESVTIKDADGDGLADVFIAYTLPGLNTTSNEGKLLVYHKDLKYSIRGTIARTPDDFGSRNISANYPMLPAAVQALGLQIWDQISLPPDLRKPKAEAQALPTPVSKR